MHVLCIRVRACMDMSFQVVFEQCSLMFLNNSFILLGVFVRIMYGTNRQCQVLRRLVYSCRAAPVFVLSLAASPDHALAAACAGIFILLPLTAWQHQVPRGSRVQAQNLGTWGQSNLVPTCAWKYHAVGLCANDCMVLAN